ncbi:hypothetical protein Mal4_33630 [Maioricimonas rarisocia]|uniref:Uncharacterized protein n=1 Tax=Maioricimonas rarisocia TaxID=2528026 RepID=A0A517Z972_9PLAN|nr:hypothetical protein [Maioricimonas rarisocia]QDU39030.1 hypothetical protein Mal4_33630 [Maioricimonas rarisocia]
MTVLARRSCTAMSLVPWITTICFVVVAALSRPAHAEIGVRHLIETSPAGEPYCSVLIPEGWDMTRLSGSEDESARYLFAPLSGGLPSVTIELGPSHDRPARLEQAAAHPEARFLDSDEYDRVFYDSYRELDWSRTQTESTATIEATLIRERPLTVRVIHTRPYTSNFERTVVGIIDAIDFAPDPREFRRKREARRRTIPTSQPPFEIRSVQEEQANLTKRLMLITAFIVGLAILFLVERIVNRRSVERRIRDVEELMAARRAGRIINPEHHENLPGEEPVPAGSDVVGGDLTGSQVPDSDVSGRPDSTD